MLIVADGKKVEIKGKGTVKFYCAAATKWQDARITFKEVYYVPALITNLVSASYLDTAGLKATIAKGTVTFKDKNSGSYGWTPRRKALCTRCQSRRKKPYLQHSNYGMLE